MRDRNEYIGGSNASVILGKNRYQSITGLWRRKIGKEAEEPDNDNMDRGNAMESIIQAWVREHADPSAGARRQYEKFCPHLLDIYDESLILNEEPPQIELVHPKYPFVGGHPDDLGDKCVWEYKAPAMYNFARIERDGLSDAWLYQVQHYMWCTGLQQGRIAVWNYDKWKPMLWNVRADHKLWKTFERLYPAFWNYVEMQVPPTALQEEVQGPFLHASNPELDDLAGQYLDATERRYGGEEDQKMLKSTIVALLGDHDHVETDKYYIGAKFVDTRYGGHYLLTVKDK